jgi:hypothetical protein
MTSGVARTTLLMRSKSKRGMLALDSGGRTQTRCGSRSDGRTRRVPVEPWWACTTGRGALLVTLCFTLRCEGCLGHGVLKTRWRFIESPRS